MSRESVINSFFGRVHDFLANEGLLNCPERILNIDETWYSQNEEKRKKVLVPKGHKMPYLTVPGKQEHITFAMCAAANGRWLPPLVIFKNTLPSNDEFYISGPDNALYMATESGHIDTAAYLQYVKHLDKYITQDRPIVIFQDNLRCHEDFELIEFCASKKIHLINLPVKSSHLLQPLDKVFGLLKTKIEKKKNDALLTNNGLIGKSKVPVLLRLAMNDFKQKTIQEAFRETGLCPLDKKAIDPTLLVGDIYKSSNTTDQTTVRHSQILHGDGPLGGLTMHVYDENDDEIQPDISATQQQSTQTSPIEFLPCSNCIEQNVAVHPAVTAGIVPLELASVFIDKPGQPQRQTSRRRSGDTAKGRILTLESELARIREQNEQQQKKEQEKLARIEERKQKKLEKEDRKRKAVEARKARRDNQINTPQILMRGAIHKRNICVTCGLKIRKINISQCLICSTKFHGECIDAQSYATICDECITK